jgi:hypothetical protein
VLDLGEHPPFVVGVLDLLHLHNLRLLQHLDGVEPLVMPRLNQVNATKTTCPERPQYLKVGERIFSLGRARLAVLDLLLLLLLLLLLRWRLRVLLLRRLFMLWLRHGGRILLVPSRAVVGWWYRKSGP